MTSNTVVINQMDVSIHSNEIWPYINQNSISKVQFGAVCVRLYRLFRDCQWPLIDYVRPPHSDGIEELHKQPYATVLRLIAVSKLEEEIKKVKSKTKLSEYSPEIRGFREQMVEHLETVLATAPELVINDSVRNWLQRIQPRPASHPASIPAPAPQP